MNQPFFQQHWTDQSGAPAGGVSSGKGFAISWQNGPLGTGVERLESNGAFVETLISAVIGRIEFYQSCRFNCEENAQALLCLKLALAHLEERTRKRQARGVEGTHKE